MRWTIKKRILKTELKELIKCGRGLNTNQFSICEIGLLISCIGNVRVDYHKINQHPYI